jgi:hypothetical protein
MAGAKFRIERIPARTIRSATSCATAAGVAISPIATPSVRTTSGVRHRDAHLRRVHVEQGGHTEPAFGEPLVPGQRLPEVPDPGDQDRPVLGETERGTDLVDQVGDVVANPAGPVRAQGGEILADLRRRHPGRVRELVGGHRRLALAGELDERAQVEREP